VESTHLGSFPSRDGAQLGGGIVGGPLTHLLRRTHSRVLPERVAAGSASPATKPVFAASVIELFESLSSRGLLRAHDSRPLYPFVKKPELLRVRYKRSRFLPVISEVLIGILAIKVERHSF